MCLKNTDQDGYVCIGNEEAHFLELATARGGVVFFPSRISEYGVMLHYFHIMLFFLYRFRNCCL